MTAAKSIPLSRISRMISRTAWRCSLSNKKILQARYMIQMLPRGGVRRGTIPSAAKTAHAGIILPHMSSFLAVVDFLALDFLRHRGKRPCRALLGVQFFAGFLAELGAGDKSCHSSSSFRCILLESSYLKMSKTILTASLIVKTFPRKLTAPPSTAHMPLPNIRRSSKIGDSTRRIITTITNIRHPCPFRFPPLPLSLPLQ